MICWRIHLPGPTTVCAHLPVPPLYVLICSYPLCMCSFAGTLIVCAHLAVPPLYTLVTWIYRMRSFARIHTLSGRIGKAVAYHAEGCRVDSCLRLHQFILCKRIYSQGVLPRPSTAPGLGVCEWSPEGLHDKSVSLIPNTDEILKLVKKKIN